MQAAAFDQYAIDYDSHFSHSIIGRAQRNRVKYFSKPYFKRESKVLEINCGTGEDAKWISALSTEISLSDASSEMLKIAKNKNTNTNLSYTQSDFAQLLSVYSTKTFDIIFSNFGGLNCISKKEMSILAKDFSALLNNKGKLVLVIMGTKCWMEKLYFRLKGNKAKRERRNTNSGVETQVGGTSFLTYYHSPKDIQSILSNDFTLVELKPIGYFIPPSYLEKQMAKYSLLSKILIGLENSCANFSWMANKADHYLIVLEKK